MASGEHWPQTSATRRSPETSYRENNEPGAVVQSDENYEKLRGKEVVGEPGASHRGKMRKQCRPRGPGGYLPEALDLNAAALDEKKTIYQYDQPPLNIEHAPHQHLNPMVRQMAARNRTARPSGDREETIDLEA